MIRWWWHLAEKRKEKKNEKKKERARDETKPTRDVELRGEEGEGARGKVTDILRLRDRRWKKNEELEEKKTAEV